MRMPHLRPPPGIVRNAGNLKDAIRHTLIAFFHHVMNARFARLIGIIPGLRKMVAVYRELADRNKARIDTLEFICNVTVQPSSHLQNRCNPAALDCLVSTKELVQQQVKIWIEAETQRWTYFFKPDTQSTKIEDYRRYPVPSLVPDDFSAAQKEAEQHIARTIGGCIGQGRELERNSLEKVGRPWVYRVALSRAFQQAIDQNIAGAAWDQIGPLLHSLHQEDLIAVGLISSQAHHSIWQVMNKLVLYDRAVAENVGRDIQDYCNKRQWKNFPLLLGIASKPRPAL